MKKLIILLSLILSFGIAKSQIIHLDSAVFNYQPQWWGMSDTTQWFGHSFIAGVNGNTGLTTPDSGFVNIFYRQLKDSGYNHGIGGTGAIDALMQGYRYVSNPHRAMIFVLSMRNELVGTITDATYRKIVQADKAFFALANLKSTWVGARAASVTRFGTWSNYTNLAGSGYTETRSAGGLTTSSNNDSLVYLTPYQDSTAIIGLIGLNIGGSTFQIYVDNVLKISGSTNSMTDASPRDINLSAGTRAPMAVWVTGLTYAVHTIKIVNTSAATLIVDYIGSFIDAKNSYPFVLMNDIAYGGTTALGDSIIVCNTKLDSLVATFPVGYHAFSFQSNNYYNNATDLGTDNIHLNPQGNRHLDTGLIAMADAHFPNMNYVTVMAAGGGLYVRTFMGYGAPGWTFRRVATLADFTNQYLPLNFKWVNTINTNGFNLNINGPGLSSVAAGGSRLFVPNIVLYDSNTTLLLLQPSVPLGSNVVQPMGLRGKVESFSGTTPTTNSLSIGINVGAVFSGIDNAHSGFAIYMDGRNTGSEVPLAIFYGKAAATATNTILGRYWIKSGAIIFQVGDTTAAGNVPFYVVGTSGVRLPGGTSAQRPTAQGGVFRFNTDSTLGLGKTHPEYYDGTAWHALLANGDLAAATNTIYTGDGTLAANRNVANGGFTLAFTGTGKTLINTTTDNSSARLQITDASIPQLALHFDATHFTTLQGASPGGLIIQTSNNAGISLKIGSSSPGTPASLDFTNLGSFISFATGANSRAGQVALVSGTKAITITGVGVGSLAFVQLVSQSGTTTTTAAYIGVCTGNTLTISAVTAAGTNTINTADVSTVNYVVYN